jgi:hypothetical protein
LSPMKSGFSPLVTEILFDGAKSLLPVTEPSLLSFSLSLEIPQSPSSYLPVPAINTRLLGRIPSRNSPSGESLSTSASAIIPHSETSIVGDVSAQAALCFSSPSARTAAASEDCRRGFACDGGPIGRSGGWRLSAAVGDLGLLSVRRMWRSDRPVEMFCLRLITSALEFPTSKIISPSEGTVVCRQLISNAIIQR